MPREEGQCRSESFISDRDRVDLHPGEVLTHVIIPRAEYEGYHGHYIKYSMRNAMDIATLSCSVVSRIDSAKNILEDVRITFGVAAPVPYRCVETEELLKGQKPGEELYQKLEDSTEKKSIQEIPGEHRGISGFRSAERSHAGH